MLTQHKFSEDITEKLNNEWIGKRWRYKHKSVIKPIVFSTKLLVEYAPGFEVRNLFIELKTLDNKTFIVLMEDFKYFYEEVTDEIYQKEYANENTLDE